MFQTSVYWQLVIFLQLNVKARYFIYPAISGITLVRSIYVVSVFMCVDKTLSDNLIESLLKVFRFVM